MDQEDFEKMASIGERPVVGGVPVFIPGAADAGHDSSLSNALVFDERSGRIFTRPNAHGSDVYESLAGTSDHAPEHWHLPFYGADGDDDGASAMPRPPASPTPPTLSGHASPDHADA